MHDQKIQIYKKIKKYHADEQASPQHTPKMLTAASFRT